nr:hypothetical protein [uncultured bacterium]
MSLFNEYSLEQLGSVKSIDLTLQDLRVLQLAISGDTFAPGSKWHQALEIATAKIDEALDELRAQVLRDDTK